MLPKISSLRAEQIELLLSFLSVPTSIRGASGTSRSLHNLYHGSDFVQTARTARFLKITRDVAKSTKRFQAISYSSVYPPLPKKERKKKNTLGFNRKKLPPGMLGNSLKGTIELKSNQPLQFSKFPSRTVGNHQNQCD